MYDDFIGSGEASRVLGLSRSSLQKLVDSGEISSTKTAGGHRRLKRSIVVALSQKTVPSSSLHLAEMSVNEAVTQARDRLAQLSVAVVNENAEIAAQITNMFEQCFPRVNLLLPTNALDVLLILERNRPCVLIVDQSMNSFDGYMLQLLQMMTQRSEYQSVVVVVLDMCKPEMALRQDHLPGVLFLDKPFDLQWLHGFVGAYVHMLCHQRQKRPEAASNTVGQRKATAINGGGKTTVSADSLGSALDLNLDLADTEVEEKAGVVTGAVPA